MKLYIVSGRSGSGKTTALNVFEDLEYYCVDNLPCTLIPVLLEQIRQEHTFNTAVVGIDARNLTDQLRQFPSVLQELKAKSYDCTTIFLDADDKALIKRFSETRRKHPLTDATTSLTEAIIQERDILEPIASKADIVIDTTLLNLHQLRDLLTTRITKNKKRELSILFYSFGFKHGTPPDVDLVFDVRCLPNPHWISQLRSLTGLDSPVIDFLRPQKNVQQMIGDIEHFLTRWLPSFVASNRCYMTIAIGCTGGQHRSVYIAEELNTRIGRVFQNVQVRHKQIAMPYRPTDRL